MAERRWNCVQQITVVVTSANALRFPATLMSPTLLWMFVVIYDPLYLGGLDGYHFACLRVTEYNPYSTICSPPQYGVRSGRSMYIWRVLSHWFWTITRDLTRASGRSSVSESWPPLLFPRLRCCSFTDCFCEKFRLVCCRRLGLWHSNTNFIATRMAAIFVGLAYILFRYEPWQRALTACCEKESPLSSFKPEYWFNITPHLRRARGWMVIDSIVVSEQIYIPFLKHTSYGIGLWLRH